MNVRVSVCTMVIRAAFFVFANNRCYRLDPRSVGDDANNNKPLLQPTLIERASGARDRRNLRHRACLRSKAGRVVVDKSER